MRRIFALPLLCAAMSHAPTFGQPSTPGGSSPDLAVSPTANSETPFAEALTLDAALQSALRLNPSLQASRFLLAAGDGAVQQAGALPNPSVGLEQEDTRRETRVTTVQFSQPLETGGKRSARVALARQGRELAAADLAAKEADVRADTIGLFFEALLAQERVRVAEESLRIAGVGAGAATRRVAAGKVSPVEETRAQVAEAGARIELRHAEAERAVALRALAAVMGVPAHGIARLDGRAEALPALPGDEAIERRIEGSPQLRRARLEVAQADAAHALEKARRYPDVTVSLGTRREQALGRNQALIGVSVPLPVFDRNQGAQLEALRRRDAAQATASAEALKLRMEVMQAMEQLQLRTDEARMLQQEVLPGAQAAFQAASRGFELGKFGFLDVLDAQRTWLQARSQYLQALGQAHRAAADLERRLGARLGAPATGMPSPR